MRKQRHLLLFPNHGKMLAAFEALHPDKGYKMVKSWGTLRTPAYTYVFRDDNGNDVEHLYKHERENWQQDVSGLEFYGLTIFTGTSAEGTRWALSRVRGLWDD